MFCGFWGKVEAVRLLLVNSHRWEAWRIRHALERITTANIEVSHTDDLDDAEAALAGANYDLLVVETRGHEEVRSADLERLWQSRRTPIVALVEDDERGRKLTTRCDGVQDFLVTRGWNQRLLEHTVLGALSRHRLLMELHAARTQEIFLARHDGVTGLQNRASFREDLHFAIVSAKRSHQHVAVVFIDLDSFRGGNQPLGRPDRDKLLRLVAERISKVIRESDKVACVGDSEFIVMLQDPSKDDGAARVIQELHETLAQPLSPGAREIRLAARVGMAIFPGDGRDPDTLIDKAKETTCLSPRSQARHLSKPEKRSDARSLDLESRLREALASKAFSIHYQPIRNALSDKLAGAEALIRWADPREGFIPPEKFIPIAERSGLIIPIGEWVLETACKQWQEWREAGLVSVPLSVNISGVQIRSPEQVGRIATLIRGLALPTSQLRLEITERTILEDDEATISALGILKSMGLGLYLDDFGTGYSSLQLLRRIPVDTIKIDRSYVQDAGTGSDTAILTAAIISMAHRLKLKVVAEGVETRRQFEFLRESDCDEFQGHLFHKALPPEKLIPLLEAERLVVD